MDFPKGYRGPGWELEHKKESVRRLKKTMADVSKKKLKDSLKKPSAADLTSSVEPTYPGFKMPK